MARKRPNVSIFVDKKNWSILLIKNYQIFNFIDFINPNWTGILFPKWLGKPLNSLCKPSRNKLKEGTLDSLLRLCMKVELSETDDDKIIDILKKKDRDIRL